jgi:hypothetical protein
MPQVDCPVRHFFAPGLYAREMTIPAGVVLTGAVHKTQHLCTVSKGHIWVDDGTGAKELFAGMTFASPAGAKRAGMAVSTTVFTTYHATDTTDLDELAQELFGVRDAELLGGSMNRQAMNQSQLENREVERQDYAAFLDEYGLTDYVVRQISEHDGDLFFADLPSVRMQKSAIEGNGMFACEQIHKDARIGPARIFGFRTPLGRFVNHSPTPNIRFERMTDGLMVIATENINKGEELTVDYRQACAVNGTGLAPHLAPVARKEISL